MHQASLALIVVDRECHVAQLSQKAIEPSRHRKAGLELRRAACA
jgi:hypothetical protein